MASTEHQSVLLHEAIQQLDIQRDDVVLDATLGGAGHAAEITQRLGAEGVFIGFDLDQDAIVRAQEALAPAKYEKHLIKANFRDATSVLHKIGIKSISKALFDLGWSSYQLASGRGFSFGSDEPLLMTYSHDTEEGTLTAREIVNTWGETSIADILFGWGGERYSRRIARAIIARREKKPIETSSDLADLIKSAVPAAYRHARLHPATRTFQALRIAVNDEIGALRQGIASAFEMLEPRGRIAVITFHSVEDRAVKELFVNFEKEAAGRRVTKKPIVPSEEEIARNPRSRTAKLRVIEKN
jgi:16S rRNA (cytosine1402-N4)-methyltransferase